MKRKALKLSALVAAVVGVLVLGALVSLDASDKPAWHLNATAIESCSCPMFCQCYFSTEPAGHHGDGHGDAEHYCKFNMGFKVNEGHHGGTKLDGAKFWIAGDLGSSWADGKMDWAVVHFDPAVTEEQRTGIVAALGPLFPVEWASFGIKEDKPIEWKADGDKAVAKLDGGKAAEVRLIRPPTALGPGKVVISNLTYWGAPRNDGFVLMPNETNAYRLGEKAFETNGTNGFMITVDISSNDVAAAAGP